MKEKLTDAKVRAAKPREREYRLTDGGGLFLRILPSGGKAWYVRTREGGRDSSRKLGDYPAMSLKEARAAMAAPKAGDPVAASPTFRAVAEEWMGKSEAAWRESYRTSIAGRLGHNVYPNLGFVAIADITPRMILDQVIAPMEARGAVVNAHKVLGLLGQVFRYAVASQLIPSDPTRDIRGALARIPDRHFAAAVRTEDAAAVIRAVRSYCGGLSVRLALEFLLLTFVRPGNVRYCRWDQIDLAGAAWSIPAESMKSGRPHEVPLSHQAIDVLRRAEPLKLLGSPYVFPSARPGRPLSDAAFNMTLRTMGIGPDMHTAHGFRSMASTILNERGYPADIIEKQLAHVSADQIRGIYNRAEYWQRRIDLMQAWADIVDEIATG